MSKNIVLKKTTGAVIVAMLFFMFSNVLENASNNILWAWEGVQPESYWYEYHSVNLASTYVAVGEFPRFNTDSTYYREIDLRWEDTLWCKQDGGVKKYQTQNWPRSGGVERQSPGNNIELRTKKNGTTSLPFWEYTEEEIDSTATHCQLEWKAIGVTSQGHEKNYEGTVDWFPVNK